MTKHNHTDDLEKALLERADKLAAEYIQHAEKQRDDIRRELNEKLHLSEERELYAARAMAERTYQQHVQSKELQLQAELDQQRWQQVQTVLRQCRQQLQELIKDQQHYYSILKQLLQQAAAAIETGHLVIELNQQDRDYLLQHPDLLQQWLPDRAVDIGDDICDCIGGVLVHDDDNRIRVNNTFEGRMNQYQEHIQQTIMEHLFSKTLTTGEMIHG